MVQLTNEEYIILREKALAADMAASVLDVYDEMLHEPEADVVVKLVAIALKGVRDGNSARDHGVKTEDTGPSTGE